MAGYSGTPLAKKLGIVPGTTVLLLGVPASLRDLLEPLPENVRFVKTLSTDVTEDVIRSLALPMGLVDVKVCAVDETWSGLKLVIRKQLR